MKSTKGEAIIYNRSRELPFPGKTRTDRFRTSQGQVQLPVSDLRCSVHFFAGQSNRHTQPTHHRAIHPCEKMMIGKNALVATAMLLCLLWNTVQGVSDGMVSRETRGGHHLLFGTLPSHPTSTLSCTTIFERARACTCCPVVYPFSRCPCV
jgi:hypothetical protein